MYVNLFYFTAMKMDHGTVIAVQESAPWSEVQKEIFEQFWATWVSWSPIGKHGDPSQIKLFDRESVEMKSVTNWQAGAGQVFRRAVDVPPTLPPPIRGYK